MEFRDAILNNLIVWAIAGFVPLGIWKLIDIVLWLARHVHWG